MLHPKRPKFLGLGEILCLVKMLSQKRKAGASNVRSPKRVAVIDFSEYQEGRDILGYGAGIAIYEWPALAAFNVKLVAKACQVASSLATETADQLDKAIKLALYGLHWRDHKDLAAKYLQRIGNPLVREVLCSDRPSTRLPRRSHKEKWGNLCDFRYAGRQNEKRYIHKVRFSWLGKIAYSYSKASEKTRRALHAAYISAWYMQNIYTEIPPSLLRKAADIAQSEDPAAVLSKRRRKLLAKTPSGYMPTYPAISHIREALISPQRQQELELTYVADRLRLELEIP